MDECFRIFHHDAPHIVNRNDYYKPPVFVQHSPSTPLPSWGNMKESIVKRDLYNPVSTFARIITATCQRLVDAQQKFTDFGVLEDKYSRFRDIWELCQGLLWSMQMISSLLCPPMAFPLCNCILLSTSHLIAICLVEVEPHMYNLI